MSNFLKGTRKKLRFATGKGMGSIEDLWDIPLDSASRPSINSLYIETEADLKEMSTSGLVAKPTKGAGTLELKLAILKEVFEIRTAEQEASKKAIENRAKRNKILDALAEKEEAEFNGKSKDELLKMLDEL